MNQVKFDTGDASMTHSVHIKFNDSKFRGSRFEIEE